MLQKLKNRVRSLIQKWRSVELDKRFAIIVFVVEIIIMTCIMNPPYMFPSLQEENYTEIEQVITTIAEEKNTDVEFDTSKIIQYKVTHRGDGYKEIFIQGNSFEEVTLTIDKDYQIKKLTQGGLFTLIIVSIIYFIIVYCLGYIITVILFLINRTIKKIVQFFKT